MYLALVLVGRTLFFGLSGLLAVLLLVGCYRILRALSMSADWATWIVGSLFILASGGLVLATFFPEQLAVFRITDLIGICSFFIGVYTASQWLARQWYLTLKKRTQAMFVGISREMLLFFRKHHQFLGWLVAITALAHTIYFLPILVQQEQFEVMTGFVALGILALTVCLGMWIWVGRSLLKKRVPQRLQDIHTLLTIAFFAALVVHM